MKHFALPIAVLVTVLVGRVPAEDWYRWRGPRLDGISSETGWNRDWSTEGPPVDFQTKVGTGFSCVSIREGRLFTIGNEDNTDTVFCLDAGSGQMLWKHAYTEPLDDRFFAGGPTSTPTVDGDAVYALSRQGKLFCFDVRSGRVKWSAQLCQQTGAAVPGWGFAGSPLVQGDLLILNVGEAGTAVDKHTGEVVWTSGEDEAGYASPVPFRLRDKSCVLIASSRFYIGVDLQSGEELWRHRWLTRFGCNAADPIIRDGRAFISSGYNRGSALLDVKRAPPEVIWDSKQLQNQFSSSVLIDGFLYGFDGDTTSARSLRCVDFSSGQVQWSEPELSPGGLMAAAGQLIVLSEGGQLIVGPASPEAFRPQARAQVLTGTCWTMPVLSNGRIYCRNASGDLVCLNVTSPNDNFPHDR